MQFSSIVLLEVMILIFVISCFRFNLSWLVFHLSLLDLGNFHLYCFQSSLKTPQPSCKKHYINFQSETLRMNVLKKVAQVCFSIQWVASRKIWLIDCGLFSPSSVLKHMCLLCSVSWIIWYRSILLSSAWVKNL